MDETEVSLHVSSVYNLMLSMICAYGVGIYATTFLLQHISTVMILSTITSFIFLFSVMFSKEEPKRYILSLLFGCTLGLNSGYVVQYANQIDRSILPLSLLFTLGIFLIFSQAAKNVGQQSMALLHGYLFSALWGLLIGGFIMMLAPQTFAGLQVLYSVVGVLVFCGFITYDTALMYSRIRKGETDHYMHALNLFLDIVNIFLDIIRILLKIFGKKE